MKKVIVVSKTHLDLGFTDYAENIRRRYIDSFIPSAIELAEKVNTDKNKSFVWTTGSWILKEALENGTNGQKQKLLKAIRDGNIIPHAMPFTTHTELLDEDTLDYGLSIVDALDDIRGKKTISAKMTDVPGHTKALVPLLARHGIRLLHIGVNGASALPVVPDCFLWKNGDDEIVVVYSGDYGGAYKSDLIDEVLYFDHTLDNHGAPSPEKVLAKLNKIKAEFPDYEVVAGSLDDYAEVLWQVRDKLPVIDNEIGDTWIHGSASDPYKSAALRELMRLKRQWLAEGSMTRDSREYTGFTDNLLCVAEHTCGMDTKIYFADYENYLKPDFQSARKKDKIIVKHPFRDYPYNILNIINKIRFKSSYSIIEKSWQEQREYIDRAVGCLNPEHRTQAEKELAYLEPNHPIALDNAQGFDGTVSAFGYELCINNYGGIGRLTAGGEEIIKGNDRPFVEYRSYTSKDYDFWFSHYTRDFDKNRVWSYPDFGRPLLKYADGKYPQGRFYYKMTDAFIISDDIATKVLVNLRCDKTACDLAGAPRTIQALYTIDSKGVCFDVIWIDKDANRTTEAIFLHLYPAFDDFSLTKLGSNIDYKSVVSMGGRNLHAVEKCTFKCSGEEFEIQNLHSPLISLGQGKILEYDNKIEDCATDGISYVLYNNVWGTNFPLWYEENARFTFEIKEQNNEV
ncbi:MAG: DUF5054 domain-containing protein [Eubacteriales bacterium]|nr:DUF5054 domain-containing protein [Eubacteriales bacterium]